MNKLPQMPIRAKYADELTEGGPAAKSITALQEAVQALEDGTAKVLDDIDSFDELTSDEINVIIEGGYIVLHHGNVYGYVSLAEETTLEIFTIDDEFLSLYMYVKDDDSWILDTAHSSRVYLLTKQSSSDAGKALMLNAQGYPAWIALPAAGTKLYRHHFSIERSGGAGGDQFDVISTSPSFDSYTLDVLSVCNLKSWGASSTFNNETLMCPQYSNAGTSITFYYFKYAGSFQEGSISVSASNDTVTEL